MAHGEVTGTWQGQYWFDPIEGFFDLPPRNSFGMQLKQSWLFGNFRGEVWDDPPHGMPGRGIIEGRVTEDGVFFMKWMPVYCVWWEGRTVPLEEYLRKAHDVVLDQPTPHLPIRYTGEYWPERQEMEGAWEFVPTTPRLLSQGREVNIELLPAAARGQWAARRPL